MRRFATFGTVGATGTLVNLATLYVGQEFLFHAIVSFQARLNLSLAVAILAATINNFAWNRLWTWSDRPRRHGARLVPQFGQYALACWVGITLQVVFTKLLVMRLDYLLANLVAIVGVSIVNFVLNDFWTFPPRTADPCSR